MNGQSYRFKQSTSRRAATRAEQNRTADVSSGAAVASAQDDSAARANRPI
jgi:hypothetical protein